MIALLALLLHMPVNADLTAALGGRALNGAPSVFVSDAADWLFSFNQWPSFYRHDIASRENAFEGEKITVGTFLGPKVRLRTVSQGPLQGDRAELLMGHPATAQPMLALSKNTLLVLAASGGVAPEDKVSKLAKRSFALCIVRLDARGPDANSAYTLPSDDYGWYQGVEARRDSRTGAIDVLVAHVVGGNAQTKLEAYRIVGDKLEKAPSGRRYARVAGNTFPIWDSVQAARGVWDDGPKIAVDAENGHVAFVYAGGVMIDGRRASVPNARWVRYIGGRLFAGTARNPEMKTLAETYVWDQASKRFISMGGFEVAGSSPNGKYWVLHFPHNGRFSVSRVPPPE